MAQRPSFDDWIQAAKPVNPGQSDRQLADFYRGKYGEGPNEDDFQAWAGRAREAVPDQDFSDDDLRGVYGRRYGDIAQVSDVSRALSDAGAELKGLAGGVVALAGDTVGSEKLKNYGLEVYNRNMGEVAGRHRDAYDYDYLKEHGTAGNYIDAVQYHATKGLTSLAGGLGAGLVGKVVAKQAIKKGLKETIEEGFEDAAQEQLAKAGRAGFAGGIGAYSVGQELGQVYPEAVAEAARTGGDVNLAKVYGYGTLAGAVEGVGDIALLGLAGLGRALPAGLRLSGFTQGNRLTRAAGLTGAAVATEALEEGIQNPLEFLGANRELGTEEFWAEQRQSVFAGALGGLGGAGLVVPLNLVLNPRQLPNVDADQETGEPEPGLQVPEGTFVPATDTPIQDVINAQIQGLSPQEGGQRRAATTYAGQFEAAYNEPSGVVITDAETQVERELTVGEVLERQARGDEAVAGLDLSSIRGTVTPIQQAIDTNLGVEREQGPSERTYSRAFEDAYNEPSGQFYRDPETQIERELTMGEVLHRNATGELPNAPRPAEPVGPGPGLRLSTKDLINQVTGVSQQLGGDRTRGRAIETLLNEPSGEYTVDPETQQEVELSAGDALHRRLFGRLPEPVPTTEEEILNALSIDGREAAVNVRNPNTPIKAVRDLYAELQELNIDTPEARQAAVEYFEQYDDKANNPRRGKSARAKDELVLQAKRRLGMLEEASDPNATTPAAPAVAAQAQAERAQADTATTEAATQPELTNDQEVQDAFVSLAHELLNNTTTLTPEETAALRVTFGMEVPGVTVAPNARGGRGDFAGGYSFGAVATALSDAGIIVKPKNPRAAGSKLVKSGIAKLKKANPGTESILTTYVQQAQAIRQEQATEQDVTTRDQEVEESPQLSEEIVDTGDSALDTNVSEGQTYSIVKGTSGISLGTSGDANLAEALTNDAELQAHVVKTAKVSEAAEKAFIAEQGATTLEEVAPTQEEQEAQALLDQQEAAMEEARAAANNDLINSREKKAKTLWSRAVEAVAWEDLVEAEQDGIMAFIAELETYPANQQGQALAAAVAHMRNEYESGNIQTNVAGGAVADADSQLAGGDTEQVGEPVTAEREAAADSESVQGADVGKPPTPTNRAKVIVRKKRTVQKGVGQDGGFTATTREAFDKIVKAAIGRRSNWRIKIFDTPEEAVASGIPSDVLGGTSGRGAYGWVETVNGVREATFILSRIGVGEELATFMHEVGSHLGIESILKPAQLSRMSQQVLQWSELNNNSVEARAAKAAMKRVQRAKTPSHQIQTEMLAYFIEEAVNLGVNPTQIAQEKGALARFFNNVWQAFQRALKKLGIKPESVGAQEFVDFALGAARQELERTDTVEDIEVSPGFAAAFLKPQPDRRQVGQAVSTERRVEERRTDTDRREKIAAMPVEEQYKLIYLNELTGLNNRRAFEEDVDNVKVVASIDVDSLKTINDNLGQDAGDTMLQTVARVLDETTDGKAYHISGDEFYVLGNDAAAIETQLKEAQKRLADESVVTEKGRMDGLSFSYGLSNQKAEADTAMKANKAEREATGERVGRGEIPDSMTFNTQTERAFGEAADPTIEDTTSSKVKEAINRMPPEYRAPVSAMTDTIRSAAQKTYLGLAFLKDLGDIVSAKVPALEKHVKQFMESINATKVDRVRSEKVLTEVLDRHQKLDAQERNKVNEYLRNSRQERKWGYQPSWRPNVTVDQGMKVRFNRLSPAAQQVVQDVNRIMWENLQVKQNLINQRIQETFDARVQATNDPDEIEQINRERTAALNAFGKQLTEIEGPYSPFKRHGRYIIQAYSPEMAAAREAQDFKRVEELRRDPAHYVLEFAESRLEARRRLQELQTEFNNADYWEKAEWRENPVVGLHEVDRLRSYIAGQVENETSERGRQLLNMAEDLALRVMTEEHARQSEQHSKDIRGADPDMMRSFVTQGRADAHYIANLKHLSETNDAVNQIAGFVENAEKRASSGVSRDELTRLANSLYWHWGKSMDYQETPILDRLSAVSSAWYLLFSPAYYLQNLTQVGMMSMPYMAGRFGWSNTASELGRAYADVKEMVTSAGAFDHFDTSKVPEDVRGVVEELLDSGAINITMDLELGQVAQTGEGPVSQAQQVFDRTVRRLPAKVETINRVVTGIAAYRLGRAYPDAKYSGRQMGHEHAVNYARKVIDVTHGDYDGVNTPKFISPKFIPGAKVLFQFRKFQIIQLSYLARMFNDMIAGESEEVKAVARRQMAFTLGHFGALAGGLGLPGVTFLQSVLGAMGSMFGDDDEPWDAESQVFRFRKAAASMGLPPEMVDLLLNGMPTFIGMNLTSRLGAQNVVSLLPYIRADVRDYDSYDAMLAAALGPSASLGKKVLWGGGNAMARGDYYKAAENVLPNGLKGGLAALRQATEGETTFNGDQVMTPEEIGLWQVMQTALGLSSAVSQERFAKQRVLQSYEDTFNQRTSDLKREYSEAKRSKDSARMKELREEWKNLQRTKREAGFRPTPLADLLKAPIAQKKRERQVEGGVKFDRGNRQFVEELSRVYGE